MFLTMGVLRLSCIPPFLFCIVQFVVVPNLACDEANLLSLQEKIKDVVSCHPDDVQTQSLNNICEKHTKSTGEKRKKFGSKFFDEKDEEHEKTRKIFLENVKKNWEVQLSNDRETDPDDLVSEQKNFADKQQCTLFDKLESIIVPSIKFVDVPLSSVVNTLSAISEKYDAANDGCDHGINVVLINKTNAENPLINLTLKNVTMYRIVELVAQSSGFKFDVTDDAVVFYHHDRSDDIIDTKFFPISRATLVRLTGMQGINHHNGLNGSDETVNDEEQAILSFLKRAGISFNESKNCNLAFDGSQIIVTNTNRNLKKIGDILKKYSDVKQVEIETKFLEVQQEALDELGFRWQFGSRRNQSNKFFQTGRRSADNSTDIDNLRTLSQSFTSNNFSRGDGKIVNVGNGNATVIDNRPASIPLQVNLGTNSTPLTNFTGVLDSLQCSVLIRALEQHAGSDLMSAPKLTVLSGKTAEITVAMELRYPQNYGDTHSEVGIGSSAIGANSAAGVTITAGTPKDFAMRNIGVEMSVTPIVEADDTISLQLEPKVTEFEGFVEYGGVNVAVSSNTTVTVPSGFYQPIFSTRELHTEVNIFDGATVVMGGLTREEVKEVRDKVPILGDIPLLGRLFSSKGSTTQKRNLLIFVTAHTITPDGNKRILPFSSKYQQVKETSSRR